MQGQWNAVIFYLYLVIVQFKHICEIQLYISIILVNKEQTQPGENTSSYFQSTPEFRMDNPKNRFLCRIAFPDLSHFPAVSFTLQMLNCTSTRSTKLWQCASWSWVCGRYAQVSWIDCFLVHFKSWMVAFCFLATPLFFLLALHYQGWDGSFMSPWHITSTYPLLLVNPEKG